ncbi:DUF2628 domain-containing protein [Hoeflea ulvae]|uniref:DUF2628 domain-containing protein n=1 Tax=Hoeflea ulvae TaxID=2983764 RepID=A0ABT3YAD9_9HYPH|nr:DUF2628 domain-containing protein [Hoeflea ulvae]MCY0092833.1 DUF2628 domain-containing protein [Hoeflea ulvae]
MTAYLVLASPGAEAPDERSEVIADSFAPWAFLAPVIWLLFNRLWLEAVAAFLVVALATVLAVDYGQVLVAMAISLALSLITALEGRNWRASALQRRGWRLVDVIGTDDPGTAFEIHAARALSRGNPPAAMQGAQALRPLKPGRPGSTEAGSIGMVPVERN